MPKTMVGRRVFDNVKKDFGTVTHDYDNGTYLVEWDDPPPHTRPITIPYKYFQWADRADPCPTCGGTGTAPIDGEDGS